MDLFAHQDNSQDSSKRPLADRLRPKDMNSLLGQSFFQDQGVLKKLYEARKLPSLILWGPPGTGKTSFARILAESYGIPYVSVNAISTGAKELRELGKKANDRRLQFGDKSLLFIDEIHRLNKSQQDVLLPFVEAGDFLLIGATTENPSFEVNSALMSRCRLVKFEKLDVKSLSKLIERAFERYSIKVNEVLSSEAISALATVSNGDARKCLNLTEQILNYYEAVSTGGESIVEWPVDENKLKDLLPAVDLYYDRTDGHYDTASALIKSIRGSDPDAAVYYLARMIRGGEDPKFIARRLIVSASEDIGNADPRAVQVAISCMQALEYVGLPEAGINLAQATTYLASAPKSNRSYEAYKKALNEVDQSGNLEIPYHIRNAPTKMMKNIGYGKNYEYAHNTEDGAVSHTHLPKEIENTKFYEPKERGYEKHIVAYMKFLADSRKKNI